MMSNSFAQGSIVSLPPNAPCLPVCPYRKDQLNHSIIKVIYKCDPDP